MSGSLATKLKKFATSGDGPHFHPGAIHLITPSGTSVSRVTINGTTYTAVFVMILDCSCDVILRMEFLTANEAIIA